MANIVNNLILNTSCKQISKYRNQFIKPQRFSTKLGLFGQQSNYEQFQDQV